MPFNRLEHDRLGKIRPRFRLRYSGTVEDAMNALQKNLTLDKTVVGMTARERIHVRIPKNIRHYWSPEIHLTFEEYPDGNGTLVRCLAGPAQPVWTLFMFIYAVIGIITVFSLMFGCSQLQLGHYPFLFWIAAAGAVLFPSIRTVSLLGQKKARDQTLHLVSFVYHALDDSGTVERV